MLSLFLRKSKQRTWNKKNMSKQGFPDATGGLNSKSLEDFVVNSGVKLAQNDLMVQGPGNEIIVLIALDCNHTQRWRWDSLLNSKCL